MSAPGFKPRVLSGILWTGLAATLGTAALPAAAAAQVEVANATVTELQEAMSAGLTTSVEITRAYLDRIGAYDDHGPRLNAILRLNPNALAEAEAADRERAASGPRSALHGIPVVLKESYDVLGLPTSGGSLALAGLMPLDDAYQVRRLREAGAVILGKANMHELSGGITTTGSLGGQTLNPYDLTRNPGGSSGGTAVAVAASFAAVGWGTDACGSIRVPASQNNLVGLRATKGLSSIDGILPLARSHDVAGPMARTVRDLAIALDATIGFDPADPFTRALEGRTLPRFVAALDPDALRGARIGVLASFFGTVPEDQMAAMVAARALQEMVSLGATPVPLEIPGLEQMIAASIVMGDEFKWDLIDYLAGVPNAPVRSLREILELGLVDEQLMPYLRELDAPQARLTPEYLGAVAARETLLRATLEAMDALGLDAIAYPTLLRMPSHLDDPQRGSNCRLSTTTGMPALSVPAGFTEQGLPIGLELLGRPFEDERLLAMGYAYEQATDHRRSPPAAPPLVDGKAPAPVSFTVVADAAGLDSGVESPAHVQVDFVLDEVLGTLAYHFRMEGLEPDEVYAIVLRARDLEGSWVVTRSLSRPGMASGSGVFALDAALRSRLAGGELYVDVFTRDDPLGAARARVLPPY